MNADRGRRGFRHAERTRDPGRRPGRNLGPGDRRVSAASPPRRPGPRDAVAPGSHGRPRGGDAQGARRGRRDGRGRRGSRHRHHRIERRDGRREPRASRRVLSLVRPPREGRGPGDHRARPPRGTGGDRVVRRHLFPRMGLRQASALAPAQPGQARAPRHGPRALRHGRRHAGGRHRPQRDQAQRLRHGAQVDVESALGRVSAAGLPVQGRPALRRHPRQARGRMRDVGRDRRKAVAGLGRQARAARRHPDPRRRLRCPLGRHRRRRPRRGRRQRRRHLHLHHRHRCRTPA